MEKMPVSQTESSLAYDEQLQTDDQNAWNVVAHLRHAHDKIAYLDQTAEEVVMISGSITVSF